MSFSEQAPNRALIIDDIRTWLRMITEANGFPLDVVTVDDRLRQADEVALAEMPWLGVFAAPGQQAPRYFPFGRKEEIFDVLVVGHVRGSSQAEKEEIVSLLESAIETQLQRDPTRDGFSVDTIAVSAPDTDEAQPDKGGRVDRVVDLQIRYRCSFFPGDDARQRVAHGELYFSGAPDPTNINTGAYVPLEGATTLGSAVSFDSPTAGRLRHTGVKTRLMRVEASGVITPSIAGAVTLAIRHNGTALPASATPVTPSGAGAPVPFAVAVLVELAENDYVDLAMIAGSAGTVTLAALNLSAVPVSRF